MQVEMMAIDEIKEYANNPRDIPESAVDAVAHSIRTFGFRNPCLLDRDNTLIAGHTRVRAAKRLGMKQVPIIRADDLTPEQVNAFRLADNKLHELAEWNVQLLPLELSALQDANFDLSALGFSQEELAKLMAPAGTQGLTDPDEVPAAPEEPITRPGDLWLLGAHTVCPHCKEVNEI